MVEQKCLQLSILTKLIISDSLKLIVRKVQLFDIFQLVCKRKREIRKRVESQTHFFYIFKIFKYCRLEPVQVIVAQVNIFEVSAFEIHAAQIS